MLSSLEQKITRATQGLEREALIDEDLALKETHELIDPIEFPRNPDINDTSLFSPKVARLITILNLVVNKMEEFCGIIFVERRQTALALQTVIESLDSLKNARSGVLIGHGTTDEGDIQMSFRDQNKTIEKFKTGELNLLIATNVAEEGLDIQPCNVVIRFDFFHTLIGYIQSRGRARRKDSKYMLLVEKGNSSQQGMLEEFRALEKDMKNFIQVMPEERNIANKYSVSLDTTYDSDDDDSSDGEDYMESAIIVPETGATITKQNAVPLIHRYCSSLPSDSFCVLKPTFEIIGSGDSYVCKLTLPSNAAFQEMESPPVRSKDHAKALVALRACAQLRTMEALDKHLMPRNLKKEILGEMAAQYDENGYIIGSRRRHGFYEKRTPGFWARVKEVEEEIAIEDNPDLLLAQVSHTTVAVEEVHLTHNKEVVGTEAGVNDDFEKLNQVNELQLGKPLNKLVEEDGKMIKPIIVSGDSDELIQNDPFKLLANGHSSPLINGNHPPTENGNSVSLVNGDGSLEVLPVGKTNGVIEDTEEKLKQLDLDDKTKDERNGTLGEAEEVEEELGEGPFPCWFTIIEVNLPDNQFEGINYRRLCLISKKPFPDLPDLKLFHKSVPFMVHLRNLSTELSFEREKIVALSEYMLKLVSALVNKEFRCPVIDVPYFIVPLVKGAENKPFETLSALELESLLDWKEVNQIIGSQITDFSLDDTEFDSEDSIVIDQTDNSRRYFVTKVCHDMTASSPVPTGEDIKIRENGYATFLDYYQEKGLIKEDIDLNQPMLEVKRLKKVMNFLYPGHIVQAQIKGALSTWTLPSFCKRFFMSASVYQATMMIPSIMTRIDSLLLIRQSRERYDLTINDAEMLEAYTCPSASMEMDYERLETLGGNLFKK